ncbi:TetR/AcrR family transcriptional regulator [Amycolatopsis taiwanensis]|uniref:TetR/AcrR family transcriptional regulator n=1 Tax=Amycolatopsis taiwanensis TaxID=342230 RepID=UPI0004823BFC|nr:TetR/AcrR family transcriptional regulator [Amycolatopsis taiwanensis]
MATSAGAGDPVRTLELLWEVRQRSGLGRKPELSLDQVVSAAIELADTDGLDSLSMRRVADRLGVGTMSLYRYVPGKAEMFDIMVDRVSAEIRYHHEDGDGWRSRLERVARANRALFERHPWLLTLFPRRPPLGPGVIAKYNAELRAVDGIGLTDVEMDSVLTLVLEYVRGATANLIEWKKFSARTEQSDDQWWATLAPHLDRLLDHERYALAVRVGTAATTHYNGVHDAEHAFEFGLQRVIDGIESFVNSK